MQRRLLIVEDDPALREMLTDYFGRHGFGVEALEDGVAATAAVLAQPPDVVILDQMLPGLSGLEVCQRIRRHSSVPILMLTAVRGDIEEVAGLEAGVDDYVTKPCAPRVLLARVRALLRRTHFDQDAPAADDGDDEVVHVGALTVNRSRRLVLVDGHDIQATSAEHDLAWVLASRVGTVVTRNTLSLEVRGVPYDGVDRGVDIHVSRLRRKLAESGLVDVAIRAVRGEGYQLVRTG